MTTYEIRCAGKHSMTTKSVHQMLRRLAALSGAAGPVTVTADGTELKQVEVDALAAAYGTASEDEALEDMAAHPSEVVTLAGGARWQRNASGGWTQVAP